LKKVFIILLAYLALQLNVLFAREKTQAKYSADVPESLLTPNKVETDLLKTLKFTDGLPDEETVNKTYIFLT